MRYGIPTGYKPRINRKQTQQYAFVFTEKLVANLTKEFSALNVDFPAVVDGYSGLQPAAVNRPIAFDTLHSSKVHRVLTDPDCFLTASVTSYAPDFGRALLVRGTFINRDVKITNVQGVCSQSIMIEGRIVALDAVEWQNFLSSLVTRAIATIKLTVLQLDHFHASNVTSFVLKKLTVRQVKETFWAQGAIGAIELACQKHSLITIESPYLLYEPEELRVSLTSIDTTRFVRCCFYSSSCESCLTFLEAGIRPDVKSLMGLEKVLRDQNKYGGEFVENLLAGEILPTFFVKFNVSQLLMAILGKVHVAEVVSSVWSEDFLRHCLSIGLEIM